ncbi:hypothetical protein BGZ94_000325 [Podila epigama]|nr:hypothetical protein BGZ94_000325 [Podila epigama]
MFSFQDWSTYFDIPRFEHLTGLQVKEWIKVKPMTQEELTVGVEMAKKNKYYQPWEDKAENVTCQIIHGFGVLQGVSKVFSRLFLLRVTFVDPPPSRLPGQLHDDAADLNDPHNHTVTEVSLLSDLVSRYQDWDEQTLLLSHAFGLKGSHSIRPWDEIGQHMHFRPEIVDFARSLVYSLGASSSSVTAAVSSTKSSQNNNRQPIPTSSSDASHSASPLVAFPPLHTLPSAKARPYIAVHLRRNDIVSKCIDKKVGITQAAIDACSPSIERYAAEVKKAQAALRKKTQMEPIVVVTTDTTSQADLTAILALGWHRVDHSVAGTRDRYGLFGAAIVDSAILAHADTMVGTFVSTMSQIAENRQRSWFQQKTLYPRTLTSSE